MITYDWTNEAEAILKRMTLEEKALQMRYEAPALEKAGLKDYNWWNEALHGVARAGVATMFPQSIALAATFDTELVYRVADCASTEARAKYNESQRRDDRSIYKGLTFWAPNINIFRDPRWGRGHETYGEDPYLTSRIGVSFIKGMQGDDPKFLKSAACAKHYVVHSGPEGTRHGFNAVVSDKDLYETYLPAFEACVKEAKVEAVMGAYNAVDGEPCCASKRLIEKILREDMGFEGHFVSDCGAIMDIHQHHGITGNAAQSAALAVKAGCDMNCGSAYTYLMYALNDGLVSEEDVDKCVLRLLKARLKLGTVEGQSTPWDDIPYSVNDHPDHHTLSLEAAKSSIVLLKNDGLLPLDASSLKSVAVIGPNADNKRALEGNYNGTASVYYTVLRGIQEQLEGKARVIYAQGSDMFRDKVEGCAYPDDRIAEAVSAALAADVTVLCVGLDATMEGEAGDGFNSEFSGDKRDLLLPDAQRRLIEAIIPLGKPVILVNITGSAVDLSFAEGFGAVIQMFYPGQMGGKALAELLLGRYSPSGRLPVTFYRNSDPLPDFEDYAMTGRTYRYINYKPLYPFGFGLSYTSFLYADAKAQRDSIRSGEELNVSVTVRNTGHADSHESTQVYISRLDAPARTPKWELCAFKKVFIRSGEEQRVDFTVSPQSMSVVLEDGSRVIPSGRIRLYIGSTQPDDRSAELSCGNIVTLEVTVE